MINYNQSFIISNFLLAQIPVKLRNSQIYENCQLWYNLNYSNFFQAFVQIVEIHIFWKLYSMYMNPVTFTGWEKNTLPHAFLVF